MLAHYFQHYWRISVGAYSPPKDVTIDVTHRREKQEKEEEINRSRKNWVLEYLELIPHWQGQQNGHNLAAK